MTTRRVIHQLAAASALALIGCSKDAAPEETSAPQSAPTEGSEQTNPVEELQPESTSASGAKQSDTKREAADIEADDVWLEAAEMSVLTDGEISQITDTVNGGEIEQAQLAHAKATDERVRQFAEHMIRDHTKAQQDGAKLVKQERFLLEQTGVATELENESTRALEALRATEPGSGFDSLYMALQVRQHQQVLNLLERQLIPAANDPQLAMELEMARRMVTRHLEQARAIEQSL